MLGTEGEEGGGDSRVNSEQRGLFFFSQSTGRISHVTQPPMVVCKNGSSVGIRTRCTHAFLHVSTPICMLRRCLSTKTSASELGRKFIKSALLVGRETECLDGPHPAFELQLFLAGRGGKGRGVGGRFHLCPCLPKRHHPTPKRPSSHGRCGAQAIFCCPKTLGS